MVCRGNEQDYVWPGPVPVKFAGRCVSLSRCANSERLSALGNASVRLRDCAVDRTGHFVEDVVLWMVAAVHLSLVSVVVD